MMHKCISLLLSPVPPPPLLLLSPLAQAGKAAPVAPKAAKREKAGKQELAAEAQAAVAAVDAAAAGLPRLDPGGLRFMQSEGGFMGAAGGDQEPPALGSKVGERGDAVRGCCNI